MKTKVTVIVLVAFLTSACAHMGYSSNPPINLKAENTSGIQIIEGKPVVTDENGKVISQPVTELEARKLLKDKDFLSIQNISVMSFKGSCVKLIVVGRSYALVYYPDDSMC